MCQAVFLCSAQTYQIIAYIIRLRYISPVFLLPPDTATVFSRKGFEDNKDLAGPETFDTENLKQTGQSRLSRDWIGDRYHWPNLSYLAEQVKQNDLFIYPANTVASNNKLKKSLRSNG